MKKLNLIGLRFERLTVIEEVWPDKRGRIRFLCKCDCGNKNVVRSYSLKSGDIKSCGCLKKEVDALNKIIHGHAIKGYRSKEYKAWERIKVRCYNKNYRAYNRYGGRGIKVCDRWLNSFENFLQDIGEAPSLKHSIDRIDNDRDYEPNNVRWATMKEQRNNRGSKKEVRDLVCNIK